MNRLYPIFLDLQDKPCLVVGGGLVALRKIQSLLDSGAKVTVVSPAAKPEVLALSPSILIQTSPFSPDDLEGMTLVIAATDSESVNRLVFEESNRRGILCNVVDQPDLCNFHVPATIARGDLKVAISTNGKCPALASRLRMMLEQEIGEGYAEAIERFGLLREEIRRAHPDDPERRMEILRKLATSDDLLDALRNGDRQKLNSVLDSWTSCLSD